MQNKSYWKEICFLFIGIFIGVILHIYIPNFKTNDRIISVEVQRDTIIKKDTLFVHQTIIPLNEKNVLLELKRQQIPHANIVLAQSKLETGNYTSKLCKQHYNLFGIRKNNGYKSYSNWKESINDYKRLISSRYKGGDYYQFLQRINYAENESYITILKGIV